MKKQLNTAKMLTELSESPFFTRNTPLPQVKQVPEAPVIEVQPPSVVKPVTPALKAVAPLEPIIDDTPPSSKRAKERMPFDFYTDQLNKLRDMRDQAKSKNQYFSMATHVRNALDDYLAKIKK